MTIDAEKLVCLLLPPLARVALVLVKYYPVSVNAIFPVNRFQDQRIGILGGGYTVVEAHIG